MSLRKHVLRLAFAGAVFSVGETALAQNVPPAAPIGPAPTLLHFLGLRQGSWQFRDGLRNRNGNRPNRERKPPLKRIADPALAEVDNAAIKKAQAIKAEEDLAPQKIKAIKYLATLGCEKCYGGIEEAMLESLKDCTEEVRYETVLALQSIPNAECPMCDNDCCTEKMTEQLAKMAYERDPDHPDCWLEPSARVREAAAEAIGVCCPNRQAPPTAEGTPIEGGGPIEGPIEGGSGTPPPPPTPMRSAAKPTNKLARTKYSIFDSLTQSKPKQRSAKAARSPVARAGQPSAFAGAKPPTVWIGDERTQHDLQPTPAGGAADQSYAQPEADEALGEPSIESAVETAPTILRQPGFAGRVDQFTPEDEVEAQAVAHPVDEQPTLQPAIRQPSNLTRRAQRPALVAASSEIARPAATVLQQPSSIKAPVRRISAEEPIFAQPIEDIDAAIIDTEMARAAEAQARQMPEADAPITTHPVAAHGVAFDRTAAPVKVSDQTAAGVRGTIAKVSAAAGTVQIRFPGGTKPAVGSRVQVHHRYLMKMAQVGELEIVAVGSDFTTARAVDNTNLSKIGSGDIVVLLAR